ncbi:hypothetical protein BAAM0483_02145 [Bifidobacterium animalis subsp. animalis MCC 0483]|uniref:Uncharacterized protein n=1 Tax=Bifidobacterium animalis subsp. animalis MCC 0483 TaxID=1365955 RepID=A0AB34TAL3_9BIFI|nr:hypothetical protein BAAM0483_02145 [Bifidobacterium animalis subsp. animalis MCC 0483]
MVIAKNSFSPRRKRRLAAVFVSLYAHRDHRDHRDHRGIMEIIKMRWGSLLFCVKSDIWESYLSLFTPREASKRHASKGVLHQGLLREKEERRDKP